MADATDGRLHEFLAKNSQCRQNLIRILRQYQENIVDPTFAILMMQQKIAETAKSQGFQFSLADRVQQQDLLKEALNSSNPEAFFTE